MLYCFCLSEAMGGWVTPCALGARFEPGVYRAFETGRNGRAPAEKRSENSGFLSQICCKSGHSCWRLLLSPLFCPDSPALPLKSSRISALFEAEIRDSGRNVDP